MHNYQYVFLVPCYLPTPSHNQHILFADFSWANKFPRCSHLQLHLSQLKLVDVKLFFCCNYGIHGFSQVRINKWTFIQEMLIQSWTWRPTLPEHSSDWDSSPLTFHPSENFCHEDRTGCIFHQIDDIFWQKEYLSKFITVMLSFLYFLSPESFLPHVSNFQMVL
jgi:hypothetical protein